MARPVIVEYLDSIKADVVAELERELVGNDRLATLQNRLYVLRRLVENMDSDIANGKVAEKHLREVDDDAGEGDV